MKNQPSSIVRRFKNFSYLPQDQIGQGATGKVYKGINQQNGEQVAIKILQMSEIDNEVTQYLLACEKQALGTIASPYVLSAYDIVQTEDQCLMVTPLCTGGTLKEYIKGKGRLQENQALFIFVKLLRGYVGIRDKGFIHRDLKSSNIMFRNGEPVIIDFGYCEKNYGKKPKIFYNVGSPSYMSPEAYYKTVYSEKSDLWALGVILFEMLEGSTIDHGQPIDRYFSMLLKNGFQLRNQVSMQTYRLLGEMLNPNANARPPAEVLIQRVQRMIFQGNQQQPHNARPSGQNRQLAEQVGKISLKQAQKKLQQHYQAQQAQHLTPQHAQNPGQQKQSPWYVHPQQHQHQQQANIQQRFSLQNPQAQNFSNNLIKMSESIYKPDQQSQRPGGRNGQQLQRPMSVMVQSQYSRQAEMVQGYLQQEQLRMYLQQQQQQQQEEIKRQKQQQQRQEQQRRHQQQQQHRRQQHLEYLVGLQKQQEHQRILQQQRTQELFRQEQARAQQQQGQPQLRQTLHQYPVQYPTHSPQQEQHLIFFHPQPQTQPHHQPHIQTQNQTQTRPYQSYIQPPTHVQNQSPSQLELNQNIKVCHSNIFQPLQTDRTGQADPFATMPQNKLVQSVQSNSELASIRSSLNSVKQDTRQIQQIIRSNQVVQSVIMSDGRRTRDSMGEFENAETAPNQQDRRRHVQAQGQRPMQNGGPVFRSVIIGQQGQQQPGLQNRFVTQSYMQNPEQMASRPVSRQGQLPYFLQTGQKPPSESHSQKKLPVYSDRQIPINQVQHRPINIAERNFLKKTQPYFHMAASQQFKIPVKIRQPANPRLVQQKPMTQLGGRLVPARMTTACRVTRPRPETQGFGVPTAKKIYTNGYA